METYQVTIVPPTQGLVVEVREAGEQLDHYQRRMDLVKVTKECTPQESKTLEES